MRYIILFYLLLPTMVMASDLSDSNKLFDFVETTFPEIFFPADSATVPLGDFLVRYYSETNTYIGTKDGAVYVYGAIFNGLMPVGSISDYVKPDLDGDQLIAQLFSEGRSDVQVQGKGVVIVVLSDDLDGDRHQRFIVKLNSGQTLLVTHNIDLALKIDSLSVNDEIEFFGEYEWNDEGGVVHWTHNDPAKKHIDGWLMHKTIIYQ